MNEDGSISTPFFEKLKPIIPLLEVLSIEQIRIDVTAAAYDTISDMRVFEIEKKLDKIGANRLKLMTYIVNLALAEEGLSVLPTAVLKKGYKKWI